MKELAVQLKCVVLNGQIEKWLESDKADIVAGAIRRGDKFVEIGGELINTTSVVGIFNAQTMSDKIRRRNREWQCQHGNWWTQNDRVCQCQSREDSEENRKIFLEMQKKFQGEKPTKPLTQSTNKIRDEISRIALAKTLPRTNHER